MTKNVNIRFDDKTHARLKAAAERDGRSFNSELLQLVNSSLAAEERRRLRRPRRELGATEHVVWVAWHNLKAWNRDCPSPVKYVARQVGMVPADVASIVSPAYPVYQVPWNDSLEPDIEGPVEPVSVTLHEAMRAAGLVPELEKNGR